MGETSQKMAVVPTIYASLFQPLSQCKRAKKALEKVQRILADPGSDSGGEGKSKRAEKYGTKKSKERREEPLGTMSYQTSSNGRRRSGF